MRILVVSTWYPTHDAPFRTPFVTKHVRAIARDHDVHVIHLQLLRDIAVSEETFDGTPVTRVSFDPRKPLSMVRALDLIRRWATFSDVVHTMAFSSALVAAPAICHVPWVHTEHWNGVAFPRTIGATWSSFAWVRHVLRLPTIVTGVSSLMNDALKPFARKGRVRTLGNVVDYAPRIEPRPESESIRLISVGSLIERKNPVLTVETLSWLRSHGYEATLVWDGQGPLLQAAQQRARQLDIEDFVDFKGQRTGEQLWEDLSEASVFVLLSSTETFCVAAAEALAAGRPVVMGDVGGQKDFINPSNGRMVGALTPSAVGQAVLDVIDDPDLASPEKVAREIRDQYGAASISDTLTNLYREALAVYGEH